MSLSWSFVIVLKFEIENRQGLYVQVTISAFLFPCSNQASIHWNSAISSVYLFTPCPHLFTCLHLVLFCLPAYTWSSSVYLLTPGPLLFTCLHLVLFCLPAYTWSSSVYLITPGPLLFTWLHLVLFCLPDYTWSSSVYLFTPGLSKSGKSRNDNNSDLLANILCQLTLCNVRFLNTWYCTVCLLWFRLISCCFSECTI